MESLLTLFQQWDKLSWETSSIKGTCYRSFNLQMSSLLGSQVLFLPWVGSSLTVTSITGLDSSERELAVRETMVYGITCTHTIPFKLLTDTACTSTELFRIQAVSSVKNGYSTIPKWFNAFCVKPPGLSVASFVEDSCSTSKEVIVKLSNSTFFSESNSTIGRYYSVQYLTDDFTSSGKSNIIEFYGLVFAWSRGFSTKPVTKNVFQNKPTLFDRSYATFAQ